MFGIEVKPKGKRKYKRLSISMLDAQAMKRETLDHVSQYCKDFGLDLATTDYRVVNRDTDSVIAVKKQFVIH